MSRLFFRIGAQVSNKEINFKSSVKEIQEKIRNYKINILGRHEKQVNE